MSFTSETGRAGAAAQRKKYPDAAALTANGRTAFMGRFKTAEEKERYFAELGHKSQVSQRAKRLSRQADVSE